MCRVPAAAGSACDGARPARIRASARHRSRLLARLQAGVALGIVLAIPSMGIGPNSAAAAEPESGKAADPPAGAAAAPEIVVTSTAPVDVYERAAGQTVTTLDRDQFKDQPAFSIGEILQESPGVTFRQGNGPRDNGISIRGSNARNGFGIKNIQILEDGFPVTQPDGLSRTDITDPHAYAGIDVYRGPSSAMFGNYATGGAINFRTRRGGDIRGFEIGSDVGSFGYFNEYAMAGDKGDQYEYSLFGSYVRGDGFISNSAFETTTEDILASYAPTANDTFTFKLINNNLDTSVPLRQSLNQFRQNPFQKGCEVASAAAAALGCGSVNLFANGVSGTRVLQSAAQADLGRDDRRTIVGARWEHAIDDQTTWRVQGVFDDKNINQPTGGTSAVGDTPAFNLLTDVTRQGTAFGLDAVHYGGVFFNYADIDNSTFNVTPGGGVGAKTAQTSGHQYNAGARGREEVDFTSKVTGILGLGVEYSKIDATNSIFSGAGTTVIPGQRDFYNVAPEAGLQYRPSDEWLLRGRVSTGYGIPQSGNLFVTPAGTPGNNTQLDPQTNLGVDIGADWTPTRTLTLGVTGFYEFFENEFVTQSPGAGLQNFTSNVPASEHRGIEATADWRPAPGWRLFLSYTLNDQYYTDFTERLSAGARSTDFDRSGNKIPGVEPHFLFARFGYDQPDGVLAGLGAFVDFTWRDEFFIDNANLVKAPGYELVNLNLHYNSEIADGYLKGLQLFFAVQNLFDQTYVATANNVSDSINAASGLQNPASTVAAATGSIYAGAPRTFIGGVRLRF